MAWPNKIFVATTLLGIYYTDDFANPAIQPTWTAINAGLPALDCNEFDLDPFDQLNRQYVLLWTGETLYRRENAGNWVSILTPAQARTACGQVGGTMGLRSFCADLTVPGRLWALFRWNTNTYAIRSDDYGDNWTGHLITDVNTEDVWHIRSSGDYVFLVTYAGTLYLHNDWTFYSSDAGNTWGQYYNWEGHHFGYNPLTPNRIYELTGITGTHYLTRITSGGVGTDLQTNNALPSRQDSMWFDYTDPDHHRCLEAGDLHVTTDEWATIDTTTDTDPNALSFAPWAGADIDQMLVGLTAVHPANHHVIGTLYGEADTTVTGIAGTNVDTPPYTDAIPYSLNNAPCERGIRAVQPTVGKINTHAVAMPGYSDVGLDRGIPMAGDRSAWDALNYPLRHTDDINVGIHWTEGGIVNLIPEVTPEEHIHSLTGMVKFHVDGRLALLTNVGEAFIAPESMTIMGVYINCASLGTASNTIVDVNKNGATIFTTQANRPTLAWNDTNGVSKSGAVENGDLVEEDIITIDIDQIATSVEDLTVVLALYYYTGEASYLTAPPCYNIDNYKKGLTTDNIVLPLGGAGAWDDNKITLESVYEYSGTIYLYYQGRHGGVWQHGIATAPVVGFTGTNFTKYASNPVANLPKLMIYDTDDTIWKGWGISGAGLGYFTALSPYGPWTPDVGNPILSPTEAWESGALAHPWVIKESATSYKMLYTGGSVTVDAQIGLATSPDGIVWTKYALNPVLSPDAGEPWRSVTVFCPCFTPMINGLYRLYFNGKFIPGGMADYSMVGCANSSDLINWTMGVNNPILTATRVWEGTGSPPGEVELPVFIKIGTIYYVFYSCWWGIPSTIGVAIIP